MVMLLLKLLRAVGVFIDTAVYELLDLIYRLFLMIAEAGIFSPEQIQLFATRIYAFLGLIMVFKVSVSLVTYIMNPDNFSKGDVGAPALLKGFFIALIGIVAVPYVFEAAFSLQRIVLANNIVGNLIMGVASNDNGESDVGADYIDKGGELMASTVLRAFYKPNTDLDGITDECSLNPCGCDEFIQKFETDDQGFVKDVFCANPIVAGDILHHKISVATVKQNGDELFVMDRTYFITWICGLFITYIILLFCFDIAVRSVKLSFLQLIAPIPLLSRIDPKKGRKVFDNWIHECLTTYLDLFIRLVVIYFALFLISSLSLGAYNVVTEEKMTGFWGGIVTVFLIIGILNFTRDLPKLLSTLLGIDFKNMGGFSLNPMKNKNTAPLGMAASAIGSTRNRIKNRNAEDEKNARDHWLAKNKGKTIADWNSLGKNEHKRAMRDYRGLLDEDGNYRHVKAGFNALGRAASLTPGMAYSMLMAGGAMMQGKTWGDQVAMQRQRDYDREMARAQGATTSGIIREMANNMVGGLTREQELKVQEAQITRDLLDRNEKKRQDQAITTNYDAERNLCSAEVKKTLQYHEAENLMAELEKKLELATNGTVDASGNKVYSYEGKDVAEWQSIVNNAKHAFQNYTTKDIISDYDESNGTAVREFILNDDGTIFDAKGACYERDAKGHVVIGASGKPIVHTGTKGETRKPNGDKHGTDNQLLTFKSKTSNSILSSDFKDEEIIVYERDSDGQILLDAKGDPKVELKFRPEDLADKSSIFYTDGEKRKKAIDAMKDYIEQINSEMTQQSEDLNKIKAQMPQVTAEHNYADTTGTKPGSK